MTDHISFSEKVFQIINKPEKGNKSSIIFNAFLLVVIIINVISVVVEPSYSDQKSKMIFEWIDAVSVIIFTVEYIVRLFVSRLNYPHLKPIKALWKYIGTPLALIDLLAILPFYLPLIIPVDLRVLRLLRLVRLLRIFKINRYTNSLMFIWKVLKRKAAQLLSSLFVVFILIIIASVIMFSIENKAQPDVFRNVFDSMWWALSTFTTIGYGDIYPVTVAGKILSAVIVFLGLGLVAIPTSIITSGFEEISYEERKEKLTDEDELTNDEIIEVNNYIDFIKHKRKN